MNKVMLIHIDYKNSKSIFQVMLKILTYLPIIIGKMFVTCLAGGLLTIIWGLIQIASVMTVWNQLQPEYAANMWNEALNKRLGTKVVKTLL